MLKHCLLHAINNALGGQVLTVDEIESAARHLGERAWLTVDGRGSRERCAHYDDHDGSFSVLAASNALSKHGIRLERWRGGRPWERILRDETTGQFIVCVEYGRPDANTGEMMSHTIALDFDRRLLLDSQARGPLELTLKNFRRKTGPSPNYPDTQIVKVYRLARF